MLCKKKEMSDIADIFDAYDGEDEDVEEDDSLLWLVKIFFEIKWFLAQDQKDPVRDTKDSWFQDLLLWQLTSTAINTFLNNIEFFFAVFFINL